MVFLVDQGLVGKKNCRTVSMIFACRLLCPEDCAIGIFLALAVVLPMAGLPAILSWTLLVMYLLASWKVKSVDVSLGHLLLQFESLEMRRTSSRRSRRRTQAADTGPSNSCSIKALKCTQ